MRISGDNHLCTDAGQKAFLRSYKLPDSKPYQTFIGQSISRPSCVTKINAIIQGSDELSNLSSDIPTLTRTVKILALNTGNLSLQLFKIKKEIENLKKSLETAKSPNEKTQLETQITIQGLSLTAVQKNYLSAQRRLISQQNQLEMNKVDFEILLQEECVPQGISISAVTEYL